jgi:ABC-type multidrug transport system permease subunit
MDGFFLIDKESNGLKMQWSKMKGEKMKVTVHKVGLWVSMFLSISCFIGIHFYGDSYQSVILMFLMIFPGLAGVYFSTKIDSVRVRLLLLIINYIFANYVKLLQIYGFLTKR